MSNERHAALTLAGVFVALGLVGGSGLLSEGLRDMRKSDRFVTVKGLVEREVQADLAVWTLKLRVAGNELAPTQQELETGIATVRKFLKEKGFEDGEISLRGLRVIDRKAQEYGEARPDQMRFILESSVAIRSKNVTRVIEVSQLTNDLVRAGVTLSDENNCNPGPTYLYTQLNSIKPEMLAEATKNARKSAEQFAADSGSRVGSIRQANQGIFSITPRDQVNEGGEGGGCVPSDPNKKIRVVTTVDYYLEG